MFCNQKYPNNYDNYESADGDSNKMEQHNLFDDHNPSLKYQSIFKYFKLPSSNNFIEDSANKQIPSTQKLVSSFIVLFMYIVVLITIPISGFFVIKKVKPLERCLIYRLGQRLPLKGPGVLLVLPCVDNFVKIDLNKKEFTVVENEPILTSDGSLIEIPEFKVIISVSNVVLSITQVKDSQKTVEKFILVSFKNMISGSHLDDLERKLDVIVVNFVSNVNLSLANWGYSMQTVDLPRIIVKNRYESKNHVIGALRNYFDPSSKPQANLDPKNSLQLLKQAIFGNMDYKLTECDKCFEKDKMTDNLEKIAERYTTHMNVFNYKLFNIHLVINGQNFFYTYDTKTKFATRKEKIENDTIHFTVNSKSMEHFQMFVDHNDSSGIELTTKLF